MRRAWREADELGVDTIFCWDHFYPLYGDGDGRHFEALTTMASMAEVTERPQIGALVICNSYRNPELLADAHRTIDHISGGRVILGIGAGWFQKDYDEYGYEFGDAPARLRALRRDLPRIEARIATLNPPPVGALPTGPPPLEARTAKLTPPRVGDLPILIGGSGEKVTLKLVARHADLWHGFGDAETFTRKNDILLGHCQAVGRNPGEIERTWGIQPDVLDTADALHAAGVTHLIVG